MTLQDRLSEIEERANKATPGPWETSPGGDICTPKKVRINEEIPEMYVKQIIELPLSDQGRLDRNFIAASRTDIPKLVKIVRSVERTLKEITNTTRVNDPNNHLADHLKYLASNELTEIERILEGSDE